MVTLNLGKTAAGKPFGVPIDLTTQTATIIGIRGSGKTNTAVDLAEGLLDEGQQVIVVDPLDVWWGLRSTADGRKGAYPVVLLGGDRQDLPLEATAGKVIAEFAVDRRASLILSTRHLSKNQQRQFVTDLAERLYELKGTAANRTPVHMIFDEADLFAPQRIHAGAERLFGAIDQLVRRGRSSGIGVTLITQRAAVINKDVMTQSEMLVCHRTIGPQDRKAIEAWVQVHDAVGVANQVLGSLHELQTGEAWIWSPNWLGCLERVRIRPRKTFDSSATPKAGQQVEGPRRLAEVDLAKLKDAMAYTIAKAEADNPAKLRQQIRELQQQVARKPQVEPSTEAIQAAVAQRDRQWAQHIGTAFEPLGRLNVAAGSLRDEVESIQACVKDIAQGCHDLQVGVLGPADPPLRRMAPRRVEPVAARTNVQAPRPAAAVASPAAGRPGGGGGETSSIGGGGLRRILVALAQRPQGLDARQLGVRAGLSSGSGTFGTYLARARACKWIDGDRGRITITDAGRQALGEYEPLPAGRDLLEHWLAQPQIGRNSGASRMLLALAEAYPRALSKQALGEAVGLSAGSGTFGTYLSRLRTLELVSGRGDEIRLSEELAD